MKKKKYIKLKDAHYHKFYETTYNGSTCLLEKVDTYDFSMFKCLLWRNGDKSYYDSGRFYSAEMSGKTDVTPLKSLHINRILLKDTPGFQYPFYFVDQAQFVVGYCNAG